MKQEEPEKEILTALSMIDTQKRGVITVSELRAKLTRLGEKLSEEEGIFQLKDVPNAPHLPISFPIFLCSQIWDEALPAGRPTAAGESAGAPLVWGEKGCPPIVPKMSTRASHRAIVSPGPPHCGHSHTVSFCLRLKHFAHIKPEPPADPSPAASGECSRSRAEHGSDVSSSQLIRLT